MVKREIVSKAEKNSEWKVKIGVLPNSNGEYLPKRKGWREFSGYLKKQVTKK
mgnify:CR=1 FL=1